MLTYGFETAISASVVDPLFNIPNAEEVGAAVLIV